MFLFRLKTLLDFYQISHIFPSVGRRPTYISLNDFSACIFRIFSQAIVYSLKNKNKFGWNISIVGVRKKQQRITKHIVSKDHNICSSNKKLLSPTFSYPPQIFLKLFLLPGPVHPSSLSPPLPTEADLLPPPQFLPQLLHVRNLLLFRFIHEVLRRQLQK